MDTKKTYHFISLENNLTPYTFYNSLLPQLHNYFNEYTDKDENELIISLDKVNKVSPLVIPNLLSVGILLRNFYSYPVKLFIPWNIKLITYLRDINFLHIARKFNIFNLDERYLGGLDTNRKISDICNTYFFSYPREEDFKNIFLLTKEHNITENYLTSFNNKNIFDSFTNDVLTQYTIQIDRKKRPSPKSLDGLKDDIRDIFKNSIKNELSRIYKDKFYEILKQQNISNEHIENNVDIIIKVIAELIHNGIIHSTNLCFATFQVNKDKYLQVSVSDTGIGYYKTIKNNIIRKNTSNSTNLPFIFSKDDYLKQTDQVKGILEGVFYRLNDPKHGLYDILNHIIKNNGILRIHSYNKQIIFTKKNFEKILNNIDSIKNPYTIYEHLNDLSKNKDIRYSPIRNYNNIFSGSHIEIELNLGE